MPPAYRDTAALVNVVRKGARRRRDAARGSGRTRCRSRCLLGGSRGGGFSGLAPRILVCSAGGEKKSSRHDIGPMFQRPNPPLQVRPGESLRILRGKSTNLLEQEARRSSVHTFSFDRKLNAVPYIPSSDTYESVLIDDFMPRWHVGERHQLRIQAPPEQVFAALRTADLGGHPLVRGMLALRASPAALAGGVDGLRKLRRRASARIDLASFEAKGFHLLAEDPPHELVIGLEGAFWKPRGDLRPVSAATFRRPVPHGVARAVWNFAVTPASWEGSVLSTETRVRMDDPAARRRFRLYWLVVRPGSGLIRRLMLRAIRDQAEQSLVRPS